MCWASPGLVTVHILMTFKRHGGRKVIIAPDGGDAWPPAKPRPDEALIRALARAHRWKRMLEDGAYQSAPEIAEAERRDPRLRQPAAAADAIGAGDRGGDPRRPQAKGLQLAMLTGKLPSACSGRLCQAPPKRVEVRRFSPRLLKK